MGRKKFYTQNEIVDTEANNSSVWRSALYLRLSREDGDKAESDSIDNQRKILKYFVQDHEDLSEYEIFIDDNYSGTNFNRPAFKRMMKGLEDGSINCIIIKDLSRFAREYIGAGNYIENILPKYNCRFISVIDEIDTYIRPDSANELSLRVKLIFHDYVSQKTSMSVREVKEKQREKGLFIGPYAPFGYLKNPDNPHTFIVDEQVRQIVVNIFDWYLDGMGVVRISQKLNRLGIATRAEYKKTKSIYLTEDRAANAHGWTPTAIQQVIKNKVYIGAVVQGKRTTRNYKDRKTIWLDQKDHTIVENLHEPIISRDKFDKAQMLLNNICTLTSKDREKLYVLSGYLKCADCKYAMIRNQTRKRGKLYVYYKCRTYNQRSTIICNHSHSMREEEIMQAVLESINLQIKALVDTKRLLKEVNKIKKTNKQLIDYDKLITQKKKDILKTKDIKTNCYADWKDDVISKEDYLYMNKKYTSKIQRLESEIEAIAEEKTSSEDLMNNKVDWIDDIIKYGAIKELTREVVITLIKVIYIGQNKTINIVFNFENEYKQLLNYIGDNTKNLEVI